MKKTTHTNLCSTIFLVSLVIGHVGLANPGVDWPMFQFDAAHTGYVPIHLDPNGFSLRWKRTVGSLGSLNAVTAADGKVFASLGLGANDDGTSFFVLNATTGETVWSKDFGRVDCVNPPSYAYGNVYIQTGRHHFSGNKPYLRAYDADTGNLVFRSEFAAQSANYYAPTIYEGIVYVGGGYYGGMYAFDAYDGSEVWYKGLNMYDQWTPAVDDEYAYAYTGYGAVNQTPPASLSVVNRLTGQEAFRIVNPSHDWSGYSVRMAPVIGSKNNILITQYAIHYGGSIISFDLEQRKINWASKDDFTGQLSLAHGVIYIINRGKLEARDEPTGNLLWSWDAPGEDLRGQIIVTNTHVLVSTEPLFPPPFSASPPTSSKVYAIDLLTHTNVWSYPIGGQLTIGNDALYIAQGRTLTAIEIALSPIVYYVDVDAGGANDGSSWANAYNDLQDALTAAWRGDEIRVAQGVYKPAAGYTPPPPPPMGSSSGQNPIATAVDREATFRLKNGVAIKGGYAGSGEPDPDARDPNTYETILSGDLIGNDVGFTNNGENSYHVVTGSWTNATALLDGFTITAGNANGSSWPADNGGGMYNEDGSPTLTNCIFSGNSAGWSGGGMGNSVNSNSTVTNCTFSGNSGEYGGGMGNHYSKPTLTNCTFSGNSAGEGGGMHNISSNPVLTNCTFSSNSAVWGGGMGSSGSSSPTLTNCTFTTNSVRYSGGGIYNSRCSPTVTNCTFIGNTSGRNGGGMYNHHCSPTLTNCTFAGNSASNGNTLACTSYDRPSNLQLVNCILWDGGDEIWNNDNSVITITYSDVQGGWPGTGNINANPLFVDPAIGDYHLLPDSPCINAGDPNYAAEPNETDLDGKPRVIGGRIDMGAYEYANTAPVACIVDGNRIVECGGCWGARVTLDGSCSSDADSTAGTNDNIAHFDWYKVDACDPNFEDFLASGEIIDCNLPLGEHIIVLEVIDKAGAFDTNEVTIIVQDTTPPVITLNGPATMTLECRVDSYTEPGATATDICDGNVPVVIGGDVVDTSTCGAYVMTYDATDASGNAAEQITRTVIVQDTTPPEFVLSVTPTMLWPANHKMVLIRPSWTASDICDASPEVSLVSITMNEGDGRTTDDIQTGDDGSIYLRAERSGTGSGRIYTITYQAVDDSGNAAVASATVTVPHDQR